MSDTATRCVIATYPVGAGPNGISYQSVTPPRNQEIAMHTSVKTLLSTVLLVGSLSACAVNEHHPASSPVQAAPANMPMHSKAMHEQMSKMQAAHDKLAAAKTPAERQVAMQESLQTMKASMTMMHSQPGGGCIGMMGSGSGMGAGMTMPGGMHGADMGMPMMDMMMKMMDQHAAMLAQPK